MGQEHDDYREVDAPPPRRVDWRLRERFRSLLTPAVVLSLPVAFVVGFRAGHGHAEAARCHERYLADAEAFAPVLGTDPAFARVRLSEDGCGRLGVTGTVDSAAAAQRLRAEYARLFGEAQLGRVKLAVSGRPPGGLSFRSTRLETADGSEAHRSDSATGPSRAVGVPPSGGCGGRPPTG
jgi:hypothetical protein